jgi:hypothetical protein
VRERCASASLPGVLSERGADNGLLPARAGDDGVLRAPGRLLRGADNHLLRTGDDRLLRSDSDICTGNDCVLRSDRRRTEGGHGRAGDDDLLSAALGRLGYADAVRLPGNGGILPGVLVDRPIVTAVNSKTPQLRAERSRGVFIFGARQ